MKSEVYEFLPELFLRAPFYSFEKYRLADLPQVLNEPYFQNAIWLASPVFYRLIKSKGFAYELLNDKEKFTLAKYFNRMCYRPTPFGSFATFTNLKWGEFGPLILSDDHSAILHLLPDREISSNCFKSKRPFNAETLVIKNPTIYRIGEHLRFITTSSGPKGRYRFSIDQIDAVDFNINLLREVNSSPVKAGFIEDWISKNADCTQAEARDYLRFLIEDQLLYTDNQGSLINPIPVLGTGLPELWQRWRSRRFPEAGLLQSKAYELAQLFAERADGSRNAYFYAAAERPQFSGGISMDHQVEIQSAMRVLERLSTPTPLGALKTFIEDFQARFDLEKVPLLKATDPDMGIAYGDRVANPVSQQLLNDIRFPIKREKPNMPWGKTRQFFLHLWLNNSGRDKYDPIIISDHDLNSLEANSAVQFPPSIAVMFRKANDQIIIENIGGSSATQLIGRFSMFSETTGELSRKIAVMEQAANPGVIFADIEQISDQYLDNINQRQPIYEYIIPLNVYSRLSAEQQLLPEDLYLSVRKGELILESRRLGKRVIPRLSSAYNYHHNEQPLFRLLGDLQLQSLSGNFGLDLALLFPGLSFYPRIIYKNVILSTAKWVLKPGDTAELIKVLTNGEQYNVKAFKDKTGLPAMISVGEHDQQLVVNLEHIQERILFSQWLKGKKEVTIGEYLMPDRSIQSDNSPLAGQHIGFLLQRSQVYQPLAADTHRPGKAPRTFLPGSDWLYVKLYCTPGSANILLQKLVWPVIQKYRTRIRSWFFIRYSDPGHHLRLRIRVHGVDVGQLLLALKTTLKKQCLTDLVSALKCETYEREIERYGAKYIVAAESVFRAGSDIVAAFVYDCKAKPSEIAELRLGVILSYQMISIFYPKEDVAAAFVDEVTNSFLTEFNADKQLRIDLDNKYRSLRPDAERWLNTKTRLSDSPEIEKYREVFIVQIKNIAITISPKAYVAKKRMLADLVHMQMNRTFIQSQRQKELLVYYCLKKYLASQLAQKKTFTQAG